MYNRDVAEITYPKINRMFRLAKGGFIIYNYITFPLAPHTPEKMKQQMCLMLNPFMLVVAKEQPNGLDEHF